MKTILITGATSGIGSAAAEQLGARGEHLILVGRNPEKLAATEQRVRAAGAGAVDTLRCDVGSQAAIRELAEQVRQRYDRLDVLANNAGGHFPDRALTEDGVETTFAVNYLGPFLLTELLLDLLFDSAPARVVFTSSVLHFGARLDLDDLPFEHGYTGEKAYSRSKLALILYTRELARRLDGTGVTVNAFHPGAVATGIWDTMPWYGKPLAAIAKRIFMISPEQGAEALTYLATDPEVADTTGCYFQRNRPKQPGRRATDDELGARLVEVSARLCGLPTPLKAGDARGGTPPA
ncbi:SDR family oxidoreductase [Nocardia farcinica]|uniref:SDR family oxidoreductase n=1 Tax=Nocardia farcinica TaxID=37329 RepID=UPI0018939628|nr:SDR family oxidoreductase [Nocardia farcinica]MBF6521470.1 SDR family oxidoreductase [Nocardia farcinica]